MDRSAVDPMIGRVLDGRYRVGPRIARGGMATVYEATDLRLDRVCALKVMHAGLGDDDDFAGRFVREARAAARLSHPHVVAVFDQGDHHGTLFLAMEYIPGHTLRDLIRKEAPMTPAKALALLDPILSALGAAHQAGLIHRDVKPENVLLAEDGRVKVADFGLARAVSSETQNTATGGVLIGTVSYLSPELVVDGRADARADVYAAGVVLYEMLTGRKPHEGESPIQVAYKHVHEDVPAPSALVPALPAYVDALVARATARDRDLRPADARVLLHQVRRVRAALDHGVLEDPDLTSDLTPTIPVHRLDDDIDYLSEDAGTDGADIPTILTPSQAAHAGRTDDTSVIGAQPTPPARTPPASPPGPSGSRALPPPRRRRRGPALLVLVLLLAVAAGTGAWWFGNGRFVSTPGVVDLTAHRAEVTMENAGLRFKVSGTSYSESVPAGKVMATDPAGGDHVTRHGTVTATLSRGPERHAVPKLSGLGLDDAQAAIQDAKLSFGQTTYAYSEKVPRGIVLSSSPRPGASLKRNTPVDVRVSKGPTPIKVPDYTGKSADDTTAALQKLHLKVSSKERHSATVDQGDVVSQSPDSGNLFRGDTVSLVVSKGPVMVEVPEVRTMRLSKAVAALDAAGFHVETGRVEYYVGLHIIVKQSPSAGQSVPLGSTIMIYEV